MLEISRHACLLEDWTPPATLSKSLSPSIRGSFWPQPVQHTRTHTQEGNYLILLLRVSRAQEEAEQGACHFERGSLLRKSLADTMTSFLPAAA